MSNKRYSCTTAHCAHSYYIVVPRVAPIFFSELSVLVSQIFVFENIILENALLRQLHRPLACEQQVDIVEGGLNIGGDI